jgi:hypothetical protein
LTLFSALLIDMARLTSTGILFNIADTANSINSFYWIYPAGTIKVFYQATAPTGWTRLSTQNNKALRVVSGTGGGSGGAVNFTTVLSSTIGNFSVNVNSTFPVGLAPTTVQNVGNTTLALSQLPDHTHVGLTGGLGGSGATPFSFGGSFLVSGTSGTGGMNENSGGGSHTHPFSGSASMNETRAYSLNLAVQYVDTIICSLN